MPHGAAAKSRNHRQLWDGDSFEWWDELKKLALEYQVEFSLHARIKIGVEG